MAVVLGLPTISPRLAPDELYAIWTVARAEANLAYESWAEHPGPETYAIYRAAEDRADAAQDALVPFAAGAPLLAA